MRSFIHIIIVLFIASIPRSVVAQAILDANGPGNTYELINSVLAPGYTAVENPECIHPAFGRHIAEVWDAERNQYVFEFYIHVTPDNDRCINTDRQRVEIKTYDQSPDSLIGTLGEKIVNTWQFRMADGFQPSSNFTHIHQIKAVGGTTEDDPVFTLTPRKGTPNKLELIHNNATKLAIVNLSLFTGVWVEATESITVGLNGSYSLVIKRMSDNAVLLSYSNPNIQTIRPDNSFIRPKWGIYRSLNSSADLRDDTIRFNHFTIKEVGMYYSFTGNGSWTAASNWLNNKIPPSPLPSGSEIEINPSGDCILDINYTVGAGGKLTIMPNKNFIIQGNLVRQ